MSSGVIKCHTKDRKEREQRKKERKEKRIGCRSKSIAKPPDYADRRELKSLSYFGI